MEAKGAAEAQASAAVKQAIAAEVQADAARQQVAAARQQTQTSLLIADRQVPPHISLTATTNRGQIEILNNGNGPALNVELNYVNGYLGDDLLGIAGKTLIVG